jgi:hypothetical protein
MKGCQVGDVMFHTPSSFVVTASVLGQFVQE